MSWAFSINNNQIVGVATNGSGAYRACLFDSTGHGSNINLGTINGLKIASANSINDHGQIVGMAYNDPNDIDNTMCAVLFDPTGQGNNVDLNSLIEPSSGWRLTHAFDINNNGWIVGYGVHDGQTHAFLLVPEPTTIVLVVTGGLLMLLHWRKWSQTE
jgi:probable HAF family extracellular repeat protein